MKHAWKVAALCCVAAAVVQAFAIFDRLAHAVWLAYKVGPQMPLITAGTTMIGVFFGLTVMAIGVATLAGLQLGKNPSAIRTASTLSAYSLASIAIVWAAMIASPCVVVVTR